MLPLRDKLSALPSALLGNPREQRLCRINALAVSLDFTARAGFLRCEEQRVDIQLVDVVVRARILPDCAEDLRQVFRFLWPSTGRREEGIGEIGMDFAQSNNRL